MDYLKFKQLRDDLVTQFDNSNLENITFLDSSAYDALLWCIDEYQELARKMLQHIKQLESHDLLSGEVRGKENAADIDINDQEDRKWLEHYLSLGE